MAKADNKKQIQGVGGEITVYRTRDGRSAVDVRLEDDTIWMSLQQMVKLFGRDKSVISRHIHNIYATKELSLESTVAKNATVQTEGGRQVEREIEYYNLDMILSVGYRVNSRRGTEFRIWATNTLKDVVVYSGISKIDTKLDQPGSKGYAVGFQGLIQFIMGQLPQNEVIEGALRKEVKLVPEITIRELVANALIHQDFAVPGMSVMVEIYSDRVEISSPGDPLVPVERFIDGYQSRNERLADLMRRFAICEEKSSGIDKVIQAVEAYQLPAPDIRCGFRRTEVILYGPRTFDDMDRQARIRACYQHCALQWVLRREMTNQSLRERFKLPENKTASISQTITATVDAGLIKPSDPEKPSTRYRSYVPIWA